MDFSRGVISVANNLHKDEIKKHCIIDCDSHDMIIYLT